MKRKNILAFLLSLVMLMGLMTSWAAAASFSDIEGHWSETYVEDVTAQGLVNGYDDGTFGPDNKMTYCEALLFCSRVTDLDVTIEAAIYSDLYSEIVDIIPSSTVDWAAAELAVCVELGIISLDELEAVCSGNQFLSTITREALSMYLARAMQLDARADSLDSYTLYFGDNASIGTTYAPYVYLLNTYGIIQGDENGNFDPQGSLTRGQMATLLSRALDLMEEKGVLVELVNYTDYTSWVGGTITSVTTATTGTTTLTIATLLDGTQVVEVPVTTLIYNFNMITTYTAFAEGDYVRVNYDEDGAIINVILGGEVTAVSGEPVVLSSSTIGVWSGSQYQTYSINKFTELSAGGKAITAASLDYETAYTNAICSVNQLGQLTSIQFQGGSQVTDGILKNISYDSTGTLTIQVLGTDGILATYLAASGYTVIVDSSISALYSGLVGDFVTLTCSNDTGEVEMIVVDTVSTYIQGGIKTYSATADPNTITLTDLTTGDYTKYSVYDKATIYYGTEVINMEDVVKGWFMTGLYDSDLGQFTTIWCAEGTYYETGTLTAVSISTSTASVTLDVTLDNGTDASYVLPVASLPTVYRDGVSCAVTDLRSGDYVEVTVEYNEVTSIDVTTQDSNLTGTVVSLVKDSDGTTLTVDLLDGYTQSYTVSTTASATQYGSDISVNDVETGDTISLVVVNGQVVSIELETEASSAVTDFKAMVFTTSSSTDTFIVVLEDTDTQVTVDVDNATFQDSTGTKLYFSSFSAGDSVTVYGSYSGSTFYATMVIRTS